MRKLAVGNWKMNGLLADLAEIDAIAAAVAEGPVEVVSCLPATLLHPARDKGVTLGAQDCHAEPFGAHTGDLSAPMLADAGARYVILGHSERRRDHGETNAHVAAKVRAAWAAGLTAIVCLGETQAQRQAGQTLEVLKKQLAGSLPEGARPTNTVIAYEPVWAIGTGLTPRAEEIAEAHAFLRAHLPDAGIRLIYGGSVTPTNAAAIFAVPNVDGALVGGASLRAQSFLPIVTALASVAHEPNRTRVGPTSASAAPTHDR